MCDMGNPGKDFPCEVAPDRLSRGYYENRPFVHPDSYKMFRSSTFEIEVDEDSQREKDDLINSQICNIVRETCERYNEVDMECEGDIILQYADDIMKIVKKGYGI